MKPFETHECLQYSDEDSRIKQTEYLKQRVLLRLTHIQFAFGLIFDVEITIRDSNNDKIVYADAIYSETATVYIPEHKDIKLIQTLIKQEYLKVIKKEVESDGY